MANDKLQPQAVDMEEAVLGALMLESGTIDTISPILQSRSFYKDSHQMIYTAIMNLRQRNEPIDLLTVTQELRQMGELSMVGGALYISQLTNRIASTANAEHHARIIQQKFIQRLVIRKSAEINDKAYRETTDTFDLIQDVAELHDYCMGSISSGKQMVHVGEVGKRSKQEYIHKQESLAKGLPTGIPSGIIDNDLHTGGWQPTDLIIIAARPAMGKTSYALKCAQAAASHDYPVALFSLEMSAVQLVNRMLISHAEIDPHRFKNVSLGNGEINALYDAYAWLEKQKIYLDDTAALNIDELRAKAKRAQQKHGIKMVIVDYLQLVTVEGKFNREQEVSTVSRKLKQLAKDLSLPVIALSQLNRKVEDRADKRPQLSDLRESGAIEMDADMVGFLHRPEYYGLTQDDKGESTAGIAELIWAKFRNGSTGIIKMKWIDQLTRFENLTSNQFPSLEPNKEFLNTPF